MKVRHGQTARIVASGEPAAACGASYWQYGDCLAVRVPRTLRLFNCATTNKGRSEMTAQTMPSTAEGRATAGFRSRFVSVAEALGRLALGIHLFLFWLAIAAVFLILLFLLTRGPGAISIDHRIGL